MSIDGEPLGELPEEVRNDEVLTRKFLLENTLGVGGMGVVIGARHLELDQRVAIKFLLPEAARSTAAVSRFRREARAAARIANEHVVRIFDVATTRSGIPYIVMEYLVGRDLEQVLRSSEHGRISIPDSIDYVLQASEALTEGHRLGIVHRDLKPANLFCVDHGDGATMVKVLDFGISKIRAMSDDTERTDRHEVLGSPRYMSPEQIDASADVDLRSDIWSLGVILYEAIAGQVPFSDAAVPELWHKIRCCEPPSLQTLRPGVSPGLGRALMKCLEKDRSRRYAHLSELAAALAPFAPKRSQISLDRISRAGERQTAATQVSVRAPPEGAPNAGTPIVSSIPALARWRGGTVLWALAASLVGASLGVLWVLAQASSRAGEPGQIAAQPGQTAQREQIAAQPGQTAAENANRVDDAGPVVVVAQASQAPPPEPSCEVPHRETSAPATNAIRREAAQAAKVSNERRTGLARRAAADDSAILSSRQPVDASLPSGPSTPSPIAVTTPSPIAVTTPSLSTSAFMSPKTTGPLEKVPVWIVPPVEYRQTHHDF